MQVQLVAPDRMVWSGEAEIVLARTVDGEIGILPRHAPLLGVLVEYPVTIHRLASEPLREIWKLKDGRPQPPGRAKLDYLLP